MAQSAQPAWNSRLFFHAALSAHKLFRRYVESPNRKAFRSPAGLCH
ncbi:hypothetical protein THTE_3334 [Thermogutta terrifontis]|uniref:Uncharacterized protein n=1 Tax=Thermogutta terrifontis TaxID=1331910 RepID=A0A286RJ10_9BACT|nr:hypothetical protein THTE_3334 [Thermogutta terrifontis]